jgi:hypothetical protein
MYGPKQNFYWPKARPGTTNLELDTVVLKAAADGLASPNETLPTPFTEAVPFYAAYIAKYQEQSYGEAEIFKQEYQKHVMQALNTTFTRRLPTPYISGY